MQQLLPLPDGSGTRSALLGDLADRWADEACPGRGDGRRGAVRGRRQSVRGGTAKAGCPRCRAGHDTARALVLLASPRGGAALKPAITTSRRRHRPRGTRSLGLPCRDQGCPVLINQMSEILALSGPAVVAVDQIDALIDQVNKHEDASGRDRSRRWRLASMSAQGHDAAYVSRSSPACRRAGSTCGTPAVATVEGPIPRALPDTEHPER